MKEFTFQPLAREKVPCKGCTEKFTACHDRCPKDKRGEFGYGAWKAQVEKNRAEAAMQGPLRSGKYWY